MVAAPGLWAVGRDILWCLGLGLLLAAGRDILGLVAGNGRLRCFVWDLLAFALAAVALCGYAASASASGVARWYMACGLGAGALGWRWAISPAVHHALKGMVRGLAQVAARVKRALLWPLHGVMARARIPWMKKRERKTSQKVTKTKKVLQKGDRILYN